MSQELQEIQPIGLMEEAAAPALQAKTVNTRKSKPTNRARRRPCGDECCYEPTPERVVSKFGMIASMGIAMASGVLKFKGAKPLHTYASIAFVGFTAMHYMANRPPKPKRRSQKDRTQKDR